MQGEKCSRKRTLLYKSIDMGAGSFYNKSYVFRHITMWIKGERMKRSKMVPALYVILGILLAALTVTLSLRSMDAAPVLLKQPEGAAQCVQGFLAQVKAGNLPGASEYLYGRPALASVSGQTDAAGAMLWNAFLSGLQAETLGECIPSDTGVAQRVRISGMQIAVAASHLQETAQTLLNSGAAADPAAAYDENHAYRASFVDAVLKDAAQQVIAQYGAAQVQELELKLVQDKGQWWIMPDQALYNAITGGIPG